MKTATIIKNCCQPGEEVYYCAHGDKEAILYRKCVLYLMPKGTAQKIRDKTSGKITRKAAKALKTELNAIVRHQSDEGDYMVPAKLTKKTAKSGPKSKRRDIVRIDSEKKSKWVDKEYLETFGAKCEFQFAEDGWRENEIYVLEKGEIVGMIMRVVK